MLILSILAAIVWPKVLSKLDDAGDVAARRSLRMIRDAIDCYEAEWGVCPKGKARPVEDEIRIYLHGGSFPECPVGNKNNKVRVVSTGPFDVNGTEGWA